MNAKAFILFLFLSSPYRDFLTDEAVFAAHPFYVSVFEFSHNDKDKTLEISCKIFTSDLEAALQKMTNKKIDLSNSVDKIENEKLIKSYVEKHLRLSINGTAQSMEFLGSEKEMEATWAYFQIANVSVVKSLEINNDLLYEIFPSQINILHVIQGDTRKSSKLANPDKYIKFEF